MSTESRVLVSSVVVCVGLSQILRCSLGRRTSDSYLAPRALGALVHVSSVELMWDLLPDKVPRDHLSKSSRLQTGLNPASSGLTSLAEWMFCAQMN